MFEKIQQLLAPPTFADDELRTRTAKLLNTILLLMIVVSAVMIPTLYLTTAVSIYADPVTFVIGAVSVILSFILLTALRRGYIQLASMGLSLLIYGIAFVNAAYFGGVNSSNMVGFTLVIGVAGLLIGGRASIIFTALSIMGGLILLIGEGEGWTFIQTTNSGTSLSNWFIFSVAVLMTGLILRSATSAMENAIVLLNKRNQELEEAQVLLEDRVAKRTQSLQLITEISRDLSTILRSDQLVTEVVEQVRKGFNYYHVHIYVMDDSGENLIMAGGTGDAGKTMLNRSHKVAKDRGLVGRAATTNQAVLVSDVAQEEGWLPNPLLSDTRSEIAVPITLGEEVLGVLDVQQNLVNGLTEEDVYLLQSVANQVAVALRNAKLYEQVERRVTQQTMVNEIGQKIQSALDLDGVLRVTAQELGQSLGVRRATVRLSRKQSGNGRIQENN